MGNKLYVGNLPYSFRDRASEQTFSQYVPVQSAKVMMERDTAAPRALASSKWAACSPGRHPGRSTARTTAAATWWSTKPAPWNPARAAAAVALVVVAVTVVAGGAATAAV